ncbi:MAG: hypothetical protein ACTHLT_09320 [Devosia sp.]
MLEGSIAVLVLTTGIGGAFCWLYARASGTVANFRTLVLGNYLLVQPLSGIAHLTRLGASRGYLDLLAFPADHLLQATAAALLGLVGFVVGAGRIRKTHPAGASAPPLFASKTERLVAVLVVLGLGPLAVWGVLEVNAIAESLDARRIIGLDGGTARFSFLSHWFAWIVSLAAALMLSRAPPRAALWKLAVVAMALGLIVGSLLWSGGRSVLLVMALPLVLLAWPYLRGVRGVAAVIGAVTLTLAVATISGTRGGISVGNWLDWEWGRFSMLATSLEYVRVNGYLMGETFVAGLVAVVGPPLGLLGLPLGSGDMLTSTDVASRVLFGHFDAIHVVPGFTAELAVNFGLPGVLIGYFALGRASAWVDGRLARQEGAIGRLLLLYLGALLSLRVIGADSAALLFYLFYSGTPLLLAAAGAALLAGLRRTAAARDGSSGAMTIQLGQPPCA